MELTDREAAQSPRPGRRLAEAFRSIDSYGPLLLSIIATYILAVALTGEDGGQLVLVAQILNVWLVFRVSQAHPSVRRATNVLLVLAALTAAATLFGLGGNNGPLLFAASCVLYFVAPVAIVRHLVSRRVIDVQTILGAIAAYLLIGMFFAFAYQLVADRPERAVLRRRRRRHDRSGPLLQLHHDVDDRLRQPRPRGQPGQTLAVAEGLIGQLFLVVAVAKAVTSWKPVPRNQEGDATRR